MKTFLRWLMGLLYIAAGVNHFVHPDFYLRMMPPYLPWHRPLVDVSGVAEIALGALLLVPRFTSVAAWGLIALLIAVFPANLYMAQHPELFPEFGKVAIYARLPLQLALIQWAYWYTRR